jgi:hypothetical protein
MCCDAVRRARGSQVRVSLSRAQHALGAHARARALLTPHALGWALEHAPAPLLCDVLLSVGRALLLTASPSNPSPSAAGAEQEVDGGVSQAVQYLQRVLQCMQHRQEGKM